MVEERICAMELRGRCKRRSDGCPFIHKGDSRWNPIIQDKKLLISTVAELLISRKMFRKNLFSMKQRLYDRL
jgi:hypothetical protein